MGHTEGQAVRMEDLTSDQQRLIRALLAAASGAADRARAEREAQGLPPTVADPDTIQRVAGICRGVSRG
jgi:hypothetical protein